MILEKVVKENCESSSGYMTRQKNHAVLQMIGSTIESYRNSPQELWAGLRDFAVANCVRCQSGLLRDVEDFCFAVFDCLEPNVSQEVRGQRMIHVGALAVPLNLRIVDAGRQLTVSDNAFLVKWNIVAGTSMVAMRQPNPDVGLILSSFASFDSELRQVDNPESVLAIWLYALYSTIYASSFGTIPAGVLGIASLGVGLAAAGRRIL
jgi:hypothetical protein